MWGVIVKGVFSLLSIDKQMIWIPFLIERQVGGIIYKFTIQEKAFD